MKKILLILIFICFGFGLKAHDFAVMNSDGKLIYYNICSNTAPYSVMVTYKGISPWDYNGEYSGIINIPSTITFNSITYSVDSINISCFDNCPAMTSVNIPNSVKSIGRSAFNACHGLVSVNLPDSIKTIQDNTFAWCKRLTSIAIPNSVTLIGYLAFYGDSSLTSITLPLSLKTIGNSAFNYCESLTSIVLPDSLESIGTSIFENCKSLITVNIPSTLDSIPDYAFRQCTSLSSMVIPNNITYLGGWAFINSGITRITLPNSINTIKNYTFEIHPYCVKIFKQRWYVVAFNPYKNDILIYSLDRIKDVEITSKKFDLPEDFNGEEYFRDSFGIIVDNYLATEEVLLKVFDEDVKYIENPSFI